MFPPKPLVSPYGGRRDWIGLIDDAVRLYRTTWRPVAFVAALATLPYLVMLCLQHSAGLARAVEEPAFWVRPDPNVSGAWLWADQVAAFVEELLLGAAATVIVDAATRRLCVHPLPSLRLALGHMSALLRAGVLYLLGLLVATAIAVPCLVLTLIGVVGVVPLVAVIVWAARPRLRRPWLKWLIIVTVPFGLPLYALARWALWGQALMLEGAGPVSALRRSSQLVRGHSLAALGVFVCSRGLSLLLAIAPWLVFRGTLMALGLTTSLLSATLVSLLVEATLTWAAGAATVGLVHAQLVVLFHQLRNEREGTDLLGRLNSLHPQNAQEHTSLGISDAEVNEGSWPGGGA